MTSRGKSRAGAARADARERFLDGLTASQAEAADAMLGFRNIFLTGDAGTGKSFLLNRYIRYLNDCNIQHVVMAPTGIAALNVSDGTTIHRTMGVPFGVLDQGSSKKTGVPKVVSAAEVIIIDEISMCRIDVFDFVMRKIMRAQESGMRKQVILCGDFFQLPPVITEKDREAFLALYPGCFEGWCFKSPLWKGFALEPHVLTDVVRQRDPEFIRNLDLARRGDPSCIPFFNGLAKSGRKFVPKDAITLCARNNAARKVNEERLAELKAEKYFYAATSRGTVNSGDRMADDMLVLCKGARVMSLVNDSEGRYVNGSQGTVVSCARDSVGVLFDDAADPVKIEAKTWEVQSSRAVPSVDEDGKPITAIELDTIGKFTQIPLKLAYAITIHKSQGLTFDKCVVQTTSFAPGQLYVGLSRCTSSKGLTIFPRIGDGRLRASQEVLSFYDSFRAPAPSGAPSPAAGEQAASGEVPLPWNDVAAETPRPSLPVDYVSDMVDIKVPAAIADQVNEYIYNLLEGMRPAPAGAAV